jgi:hypothetical protein
MSTLEEELALRSVEKIVRPEGSVKSDGAEPYDQGVAIWNSSNEIIGRVDYEPIGDGNFMASYWRFNPLTLKVETEFRNLSQLDLYNWINNDSEEYYLNNIKPIPTVEG